MAKPTTAAEIAARYKQPRRSQCFVCSLGPEKVEIVRQLRHDHGLSYEELSRAIAQEFGTKVGDAAVRQHFVNHVRQVAA